MDIIHIMLFLWEINNQMYMENTLLVNKKISYPEPSYSIGNEEEQQ